MMGMLGLTGCIAIAVAACVSFFLSLLGDVTVFFQSHWSFAVLFLPLTGFVIFWVQKLPVFSGIDNSEKIIEEIRNPNHHTRNKISPLLAPFILFLTLISHLFGACVGRESAAVQIGASISELIAEVMKKLFRIPENRGLVLRLGLASGFAAAFGAPLTGFIFALEHPQHFSKIVFKNAGWILLASFTSYFFSTLWGPGHFHWPSLQFSWENINPLQLLSLSVGLAVICLAYEFSLLNLQKFAKRAPWGSALFIAGCIVAVLTFWVGAGKFNGLGTELTEMAFEQDTTWNVFIYKISFLLLSVGSGFKGGEVTPLISIAALFANAMTSSFVLVAASLSCIFAYRLRVPLAGVVILIEFFGWKIAVLGFFPIFMTWILHEISRHFVTVLPPNWTKILRTSSALKRYF